MEIFLFLNKNICCGHSLEASSLGASIEYPQHRFLLRNRKNISGFWTEFLDFRLDY